MDRHEPDLTLNAYADDELGAVERARLDAHLARCPECGFRLQEIILLKQRVRRRIREGAAPADLADRIRRCLRNAPDPRRRH